MLNKFIAAGKTIKNVQTAGMNNLSISSANVRALLKTIQSEQYLPLHSLQASLSKYNPEIFANSPVSIIYPHECKSLSFRLPGETKSEFYCAAILLIMDKYGKLLGLDRPEYAGKIHEEIGIVENIRFMYSALQELETNFNQSICDMDIEVAWMIARSIKVNQLCLDPEFSKLESPGLYDFYRHGDDGTHAGAARGERYKILQYLMYKLNLSDKVITSSLRHNYIDSGDVCNIRNVYDFLMLMERNGLAGVLYNSDGESVKLSK